VTIRDPAADGRSKLIVTDRKLHILWKNGFDYGILDTGNNN
jgi:hypothetical protein